MYKKKSNDDLEIFLYYMDIIYYFLSYLFLSATIIKII